MSKCKFLYVYSYNDFMHHNINGFRNKKDYDARGIVSKQALQWKVPKFSITAII